LSVLGIPIEQVTKKSEKQQYTSTHQPECLKLTKPSVGVDGK
jgi:hypothetical protein